MCGLLFEYDVQPSVKLYFAKFYMSIRTKRTAEKLSFFILLFIFGLVKPNFLLHKKQEKTEIFFGIGVNPDCCSEGYGQQMTKTACEISKELFGTKLLYLEVRTWNKRAVSCYQKAGFVIKGEPIRQTTSAGEGVFYHMVQEME